jgi:hypothetical protein
MLKSQVARLLKGDSDKTARILHLEAQLESANAAYGEAVARIATMKDQHDAHVDLRREHAALRARIEEFARSV